MYQCQKRNLKFEMHNCKLQVERRNSLLAGDSMRVCYHGCVRGVSHITSKHQGSVQKGRRDLHKCMIEVGCVLCTLCSTLIQACVWYCREMKCIPEWLRRGFFMKRMRRRPDFLWIKMRRREPVHHQPHTMSAPDCKARWARCQGRPHAWAMSSVSWYPRADAVLTQVCCFVLLSLVCASGD